jgi:hypothetical protein
MVYTAWLTSIYIVHLVNLEAWYMRLDPHPAFQNAIVFQYWFGLISFVRERKASFASHVFFSGLTFFSRQHVVIGLLKKSFLQG